MKLHRDLKITQKSAWHLAHRLRKSWQSGSDLFGGPVEVDETFIGGKEKNRRADKKLHAGRGGVDKAIVVGIKDRETNKISAKLVEDTTMETLRDDIGSFDHNENRVEPVGNNPFAAKVLPMCPE